MMDWEKALTDVFHEWYEREYDSSKGNCIGFVADYCGRMGNDFMDGRNTSTMGILREVANTRRRTGLSGIAARVEWMDCLLPRIEAESGCVCMMQTGEGIYPAIWNGYYCVAFGEKGLSVLHTENGIPPTYAWSPTRG